PAGMKEADRRDGASTRNADRHNSAREGDRFLARLLGERRGGRHREDARRQQREFEPHATTECVSWHQRKRVIVRLHDTPPRWPKARACGARAEERFPNGGGTHRPYG